MRLESLEDRHLLDALSILNAETPQTALYSSELTEESAFSDEISVPETPSVGGVALISDDSVLISWKSVERAVSYSVTNQDSAVLEANGTSVLLTDLTVDSSQTILVKAVFEDGTISDAETYSFQMSDLLSSSKKVFVPDDMPERFCRDLSYRDWKVNDRVIYGNWFPTVYKVVAVFDYWKSEGLYLTAFQNTWSNEIYLTCRGTDNVESIFCDLDPNGIGYTVFTKHIAEVATWAKACVNTDHPLTVMGHSLGGALSQWFAVGLAQNSVTVSSVVTFNSPGITRKFLAENETVIQKYCVDVTHHIQSGDIVSMAGEAFLAGQNTWNYLYHYFFGFNPIEKHELPMTIWEVNGQKYPWTTTWTVISTENLNSRNFSYSESALFGYRDKMYHGQIWLASKVWDLLGVLHERGKTEDTRVIIGKFSEYIRSWIQIFKVENSESAKIALKDVSQHSVSVDLTLPTEGNYKIYLCRDDDDSDKITQLEENEVSESGVVTFKNLTANTDYFVAAVLYEYDDSGEIVGVKDMNCAVLSTEKPLSAVSQNEKELIFSSDIQTDCTFRWKLHSVKSKYAWNSCETTKNDAGNALATVKSVRFIKGRTYDYQFVDENGLLSEGTFIAKRLSAPRFSISRVADSPTEMKLHLKNIHENAQETYISLRTCSKGVWSDWTEIAVSELESMNNVTKTEDGEYILHNLPAGATVQVKMRSEGQFLESENATNILYLDSAATSRICVLTAVQGLETPRAKLTCGTTSVTVSLTHVDEAAQQISYQYRTLSKGKWSAWSDAETVDFEGTGFEISDLAVNSTVQVRLTATTLDGAYKDSSTVTYTKALKHVALLRFPIVIFNAQLNKVTYFRADSKADWYKVEGKRSTSSVWNAAETQYTSEDVRSFQLEDLVQAFLTTEEAQSFKVGSWKTLQLRVTAISEETDRADSFSFRTAFTFQWTQELKDLFGVS